MTQLLGPFQDVIVLGGVPSPGRAIVKPPTSPRNWNIRQGYGYSGATIVFAGKGLAEFDVDISLWNDELHWLEWKAFALLLAVPVPPVVTGLDIQHPLLNMAPWNIKSVVVKDVIGFEEDTDDEFFTGTIKFIEFRAPVPAIGKPVVSIPTAIAPPPSPEDAQDAQILSLGEANTAEWSQP